MRSCHATVDTLTKHGIRHVFALPGTAIMGLLDGFYGNNDIDLITVRHEQVAASMADGYARVTGRPGVCLTTVGPGAANSIIGVATAFKDSIPLFLITGNREPSLWGKNTFNEWDQDSMFRAITKWQCRPSTAEEIPTLIDKSLLTCTTGRPGPVHIDIPNNLQEIEISYDIGRPRVLVEPVALEPSLEEVRQTLDLMLAAERPLIFAGGGVVAAEACSSLAAFAEKLSIPVITTLTSRGCIPDDHPLCLGLADRQSFDACNKAVRDSDFILGLGTRFSDISTLNWSIISREAKIVQVNIDSKELGRTCPISLGIHTDVNSFLHYLLVAYEDKMKAGTDMRMKRITNLKRNIEEERKNFFLERLDGRGIEPQYLVKAIMETIEKNAIISVGAGRHSSFACKIARYEPRTFLKSSSFGAMGFSFPAAMGAKIALPNRQVLALSGDSDFMMVVQDLETAMRKHISVIVVIFNDFSYSGQKLLQKERYGGKYIGTDVTNPDFVKLAESFGATGVRVQNYADIAPTLRKLIAEDAPALLEAVISTI